MLYCNALHHISRIQNIHGAHAAGGSAGVEVAGDGGDAATPSSNRSCSDATCSCPDMLCHDVSAMHDGDVFSATIRLPVTFPCPLAFPCSTNSIGCPQSNRKVICLGSSSNFRQSSTPIASGSIPAPLSSLTRVLHLVSFMGFSLVVLPYGCDVAFVFSRGLLSFV